MVTRDWDAVQKGGEQRLLPARPQEERDAAARLIRRMARDARDVELLVEAVLG